MLCILLCYVWKSMLRMFDVYDVYCMSVSFSCWSILLCLLLQFFYIYFLSPLICFAECYFLSYLYLLCFFFIWSLILVCLIFPYYLSNFLFCCVPEFQVIYKTFIFCRICFSLYPFFSLVGSTKK